MARSCPANNPLPNPSGSKQHRFFFIRVTYESRGQRGFAYRDELTIHSDGEPGHHARGKERRILEDLSLTI
jgi:hypothetical protein